MRIRGIVAALLVAAISAGVAFAASGDPIRRINAADQALARSVLLRKTDLAPSWKAEKPAPDEDLRCAGYSPDESDLTVTGDAESSDFTANDSSVGSNASVYLNARQAAQSWSRIAKPGLVTCLVQVLRDAVPAGVQTRIVSKGKIPFPQLLTRTARYRVVAELSGPAGKIRLTFDAVLLGRDRINAALFFAGVGGPFRQSDITAISRLMAKRIVAAAAASKR